MLKFDFEFDIDYKDIKDALESRLKAATAYTAGATAQKAKDLAAQRLKSGLKLWNQGFSIDRIDDGFWVITIKGKLANMMEDGIKVDEIRKMVLGGNRAAHNRAEGKDYVDIPMAKDVDMVSGQIRGTRINVAQFKNADEVLKSITFSDWKKGGVITKDRILRRVQDVIKSRTPETGKTQYLTIRRISSKGQPFPKNPFEGARVLEDLDNFIETTFEKGLRKFI